MKDLIPSPDQALDPTVGLPVEDKKRRPFALAYLGTLGVALILIFLVNCLGNENGLFPSPLRPATTDRAWKTRRLEQMVQTEGPPKVLILGSSRMIQLSPSYVEAITGKKTYNYAVTGGNMIDCLTQYRYALRIGAKPDLIILNADEDMLASGLTRANLRLMGHAGLFREVPRSERLSAFIGALKGINLVGTLRSARALCERTSTAEGRQLHRKDFLFLEDGYRINPERAIAREFGTFVLDREIMMDLSQQRSGDETDYESGLGAGLVPQMQAFLHELLASAKVHGIDVYVVTTPEHPSIRETKLGILRKHLRRQLQEYLQRECGQFAFRYCDFADLASFSGNPDEFWDSIHQTPVNIQRMTNALFGLDPKTEVVSLPSDFELLRRLGVKPSGGL
jgi:hypothetical protein